MLWTKVLGLSFPKQGTSLCYCYLSLCVCDILFHFYSVIALELSLSAVDSPAGALPPAQVSTRKLRQDLCLPLSQCRSSESFNCHFRFLMEPRLQYSLFLLSYGTVLQQSLASSPQPHPASKMQTRIHLATAPHNVFLPWAITVCLDLVL